MDIGVSTDFWLGFIYEVCHLIGVILDKLLTYELHFICKLVVCTFICKLVVCTLGKLDNTYKVLISVWYSKYSMVASHVFCF